MGHAIGTGAAKYLNETTENRKVGKEVISLLEKAGHTVVNCTVDSATSQSTQLTGIVNKANAQTLDYYISIHFNAGGGQGTETYTYPSTSQSTKDMAKRINDSVVKSCGFRNRGVKTGNFYVLRKTKAPAILVEVCFVDSEVDKSIYDSSKVAKAIVEAITGNKIETTVTNEEDKNLPYTVKITADVLNIRKKASSNSDIVGTVNKGEVYTIVEECGLWGKLKSGAGWIHLSYTNKG